MSYRLFLDDIRNPKDCVDHMRSRIGKWNAVYLEQWEIARNYEEFVNLIKSKGIPNIVSFDHDLAKEHYAPKDKWDGSYNEWFAKQDIKEKQDMIALNI